MIRVVGKTKLPEVVMLPEVSASPEEQRRFETFRRNAAWYDSHARELFATYRGQHICIAGGEVFAGSDPVEVRARSAAAHPEEAGCQFALYLRPSPTEGRA